MSERINGIDVLEYHELSPLGRAAVDYINAGFAIIPLHPEDKRPATVHGLNDWSDNPLQARIWWTRNPYYNIGVVAGQVSGGTIVIDLDVHDPEHSGIEFLKAWEAVHGKLPETCKQITGSGGVQLFFRVNRPIKNSSNGKIGVDIRGDGGYAVLPPSIHPNGEEYAWSISLEDMDVAEADEKVYQFIDDVRAANSTSEGERERFSLPERIESSRNDTLFRYASSLRSTGRTQGEISLLLHSVNASNCVPPLSDAEVEKIIGSVMHYPQGTGLSRGGEEPSGATTVDTITSTYLPDYDPDAARFRPKRAKDGSIARIEKGKETVDLITRILLAHQSFRDFIKFNVLDQRLWVLSACIPDATFDEAHVMNDGESAKLFAYIEREFGVSSKQKFDLAMTGFMATEGQSFNPIKEQLKVLPLVEPLGNETMADGTGNVLVSTDGGKEWEERPRMLGTLFMKYLNCDYSSEYTFEVEKLVFRQLVARAVCPACKADYMIVLVGSQGIGKSTFVSRLALSSAFLLLGFSDFGTEDIKRIAGKLVVEIPELDGFSGRDMNKIKSVITTTSDNYRESYARTPSDHPRTAVFFGTTNDSSFLTDTTGNRRFLPVTCGNYTPRRGEEVDGNANPALFTDECERDVQQAWGETLALMREMGQEAFMRSLVLPRRMAAEAQRKQEAYTIEDPIETAVSAYLETQAVAGNRICVRKVMEEGMGYDALRFSESKNFTRQKVLSAIDRQEHWVRVANQRVGKYGVQKVSWEYVA